MKFIKKWNENPYWIFILGIYSTIQLIIDLVKTVKMLFISRTFLDLPIWSWSFVGNLLQLATVIVLYILYRNFLKMKKNITESNKHLIDEINNGFRDLHHNANLIHDTLDKKIRYVDIRHEHKDLDINQFITKLHEYGFSREDLQEIGVDENFLRENHNKLLPRNVIEKLRNYRTELSRHRNS